MSDDRSGSRGDVAEPDPVEHLLFGQVRLGACGDDPDIVTPLSEPAGDLPDPGRSMLGWDLR